ncbi:MAG: DUF1549 and DUF1553 domain-containing protein, partial [Acidobacteriota bacterium]|nr:DUF1549 and DUF1553 domain-containing protein [Acidobacteriota bacterium]
MSSRAMRVAGATLLTVGAGICWTLTVRAQAGPPSQSVPAQTAAQTQSRRADDAHESLRHATEDAARDAARLTHEVASGLDTPATSGPVPRRTFIDRLIFDRIERDAVPHAGLADDTEFVRRVYLDAIGLPPTPDEARRFLADTTADKRERLIDQLLAREEFAQQWAWFFGDLLRSSSESGPGAQAFHYWMKEQLAVDRPYDQFLFDLLTPSAKVHATLPSLALIGRNNQLKSRMVEGPDDFRIHNRLDAIDALTVDVGRVFLGLNTSCISCHNGAHHLEQVNTYLSKRTRQEFFEQAAFFGTTRMIGNWSDRIKNVDRDLQVDDLGKGYDTADDAPFVTLAEAQFPRPKGQFEPRFLLTGERPRPGASPRAELARMIADHPQFARATANLIWGRLMTVAFVEPYDGFDLERLSGPEAQPTNPELLEALAAEFRSNGFRIKRLIRTVMTSSAYQLSTRFPGTWDDRYIGYYPRKYVRVLSGPEVVDAVAEATGVPMRFTLAGEPAGRVKQLTAPQDVGRRGEGQAVDSLMQSFFQSNRRTPAPAANKPSTLQALLMMRSTVVNDRVLVQAGGRVADLVASSRSPDAIVAELFLATLAREPRPDEARAAAAAVEADRERG